MTILSAVATGVVVLVAGNVIAGLGAWNLGQGTAVPWAILPTALYLWVYWQFINGAWGADIGGVSGATRRANLRANRLSPRLWLLSLAAGVVGFAALLALLSLAARSYTARWAADCSRPPQVPVVDRVFCSWTMQSIVAGVTEEAAFRGYMQSMIERRHGLSDCHPGQWYRLRPAALRQSSARRAADGPVLRGRVGRLRRADVGGELDSASPGAALGG